MSAVLPSGAPRWSWSLAEAVIGLRDDAKRAGDIALVETCEKALAGDRESRFACMRALIRAIEVRP